MRQSLYVATLTQNLRDEVKFIFMDEGYKEVRYDKFCEKCKHYDKENADKYCEICEECLNEPARLYTEKPLRFEE